MSYSWIASAIKTLSDNEMKALADATFHDAENQVPAFIWDNCQLSTQHHSQRISNPNKFTSGAVLAIRILSPSAKKLCNRKSLEEGRRRGSKRPITASEIFLESEGGPDRLRKQTVHHILTMLLQSPGFEDYRETNEDCLKPPPPVDKLDGAAPGAKSHSYLVDVVPIDEASYEGNIQIVNLLLKRCGYDPANGFYESLAKESVIPIAGDGLTIERVDGVFTMRAKGVNGAERFDMFLTSFGWFHVKMALVSSIHAQHLGTASGVGISFAAALLKRKYVVSADKRQPWYHHLEEAILHMLEAHILNCWTIMGGVSDLKDLKNRTAQELIHLANQIERRYASADAVRATETKGDWPSDSESSIHEIELEKVDQCYRAVVIFIRDAMILQELISSIRVGDVGRMVDLVPSLTVRFAGGQTKNYARHFLDLVHSLRVEWNADIR